MLRMDKVYVIRHKVLMEVQSSRSVARKLGISRNTVAKYLQASEPVRKPEAASRPRPVTDRIAPRIDEILSEWAGRVTPAIWPMSWMLPCAEKASGEPWGTVPELLFEKKHLIPAVQQLLLSRR